MLAFLLAALVTPQPGQLKTFKDWIVGCDNVRSCHATSLMPENGDWDQPATLSVKRGADGAAVPEIEVSFGDAKIQSLSIDGKRFEAQLVPGTDGFRIAPARSVAALAALRNGTSLGMRDAKGAELGRVSLNGLSAALLYMDEAQQRIGTSTALVRPGPKPATAVPAPLPLPVVRSAAAPGRLIQLDKGAIDTLRKAHGCVAEDKDWPGYDSEQEVLDANHSLLLLGCGAGAYNYSAVPFVIVRVNGKAVARPAAFDLPPRWGEEGTEPTLVNAGWDPKTGLLTSFAKGRGIGDCGIGSDYAWDGARFRLVEQIEMGGCRGSVDYITTWRSKVVKR